MQSALRFVPLRSDEDISKLLWTLLSPNSREIDSEEEKEAVSDH